MLLPFSTVFVGFADGRAVRPRTAAYCYLSAKQLTRIFEKETGLPLGAYIRRERCEKIRELLENGELTLSEISETMNFRNEYYFNAFFKKNAGIAPGAYSKTVNRR